MDTKRKLMITGIACAILVVVLGIVCISAACTKDENRFVYEQQGSVYVIKDIKNSFRSGWFGKKKLVVPATHKGKPVEVKKIESPCLEELVISDGVTAIYESAFSNNAKLTKVVLPDSLSYIGSGALSNCLNLTEVKLPANLSSIASALFKNCPQLSIVALPNTVKTIGANAFEGCKNLTNIALPTSLTDIESGAFANSGITSLTIPQGVTEISENLAKGCAALTSVTLPDATVSIDENAFADCSLLAAINIPSSVTSIESNAFDNCAASLLKKYQGGLYIGNTTNPYAILLKKDNTVTDDAIITDLTLHSNTKIIANKAFANNQVLQSVTANNGLTIIGNNAFSNCAALETVNLSDSVTVIGDNAFFKNEKLAVVTKNGAPLEMASIQTSLNAFVNTAYFKELALKNNGLVVSQEVLFGIVNDVLAESVAKGSSTDYEFYLSLQDRTDNKITKIRVVGEEKKIMIYVVTLKDENEVLSTYLSVNAKYENQQ